MVIRGRQSASPRNFSILLPILLSAWLVMCLDPAMADADGPEVLVGVYDNPPKIFIDETGNPAGIFIDILGHIARQEGWRLRFAFGTWAEGLDRLGNGKIDLMPDVALTSERENRFSFHRVPVLSSWSQVYASKNSGIQSILDLEKKQVAVLEGSVQEKTFSGFAGNFGLSITLVAFPDQESMFDAVAEGKTDAVITNRFYGLMNAKRFGLEDTTIMFEPSTLFFAAQKQKKSNPIDPFYTGSNKSPEILLAAIDHHLSNMKADAGSVYYQSLNRWTSEDIRFKLPAWLKVFSVILAGTLMLSLLGSAVLKSQVNAKTQELRRINQEMEQRIIDRTAELAAAMDKAREADRLKSAFLATMSHELRTPLNSIIGFTGILLQELAGPLNPEQRKQMEMVQSSSRHLLALINDVLDISKIEAGQLVLSSDTFDLQTSIQKTVAIVAPQAGKKTIDLMVDLPEKAETLTTDQRRFEQVILNLLSNAVKFTEQGTVRLACRMENGYIIISISDTGIGIKNDEIAHLFQPFHQLDSGLTRKHEGTGLGLSICRKIVHLMDGSITVESRFGKGSTFTMRIPQHQGASS